MASFFYTYERYERTAFQLQQSKLVSYPNWLESMVHEREEKIENLERRLRESNGTVRDIVKLVYNIVESFEQVDPQWVAVRDEWDRIIKENRVAAKCLEKLAMKRMERSAHDGHSANDDESPLDLEAWEQRRGKLGY